MKGPEYSVIIPAHNEEFRIRAVLESYAQEFYDSEIIVVLNGCTDGTLAIVVASAERYSNVRYLNIPNAVGKGGAVRAGFLLAKAPVVAYVDADGATSPNELRRLFGLLGNDDGVIASRWLRGSTIAAKQPLTRRIVSRVFNVCVRLLFGLPFRDTQCGAKVFRAEVLASNIAAVETSNLAFDVDLLFHLREGGFKVREVPTTWQDQTGSRVSVIAASPKMLGSIVRLRLRYSLFRTLIPIFDRIFPTHPLKTHSSLSILILNWRDPKHPRAGGAERYLHEISKRWVSAGHEVHWLTAGFRGGTATDTIDGIKIRRVGNRFTVYGAVPLEYLRNYRDRFDFVIDAENGLPFFSPLYSLKPKVLLMFHVHKRVFIDQLPRGIGSLFAWFETKVMPAIYSGVNFVAISADTKREIEENRMTSRPIEVVHSGVDPLCTSGNKFASPTISYVGRLERYKRVDLLVEAMPHVLSTLPDARLVIAGTGASLEHLKHLAEKLGICDAVEFRGFVSEEEKRSVLAGSWVFAAPSSMEGWGLTVIEAFASGTPAVVYDVPGLREVVNDGVSGFVLPNGTPMATKLLSILMDRDLRVRLERGALERASEFSWETSAEKMFNLILGSSAGYPIQFVRRGDDWHLISKSQSAPPQLVATSGDAV